jgi:hypothetical protein
MDERPIVFPDIDQEIEELNQQLLDTVHELRRLEDYIKKQKSCPHHITGPLQQKASELSKIGLYSLNKLYRLKSLSEGAADALEYLEHARQCPHCSKHLPTN